MLAKLNNGKLLFPDSNTSHLSALEQGYKEVIYRNVPRDLSSDLYDELFFDVHEWIIVIYKRKNVN